MYIELLVSLMSHPQGGRGFCPVLQRAVRGQWRCPSTCPSLFTVSGSNLLSLLFYRPIHWPTCWTRFLPQGRSERTWGAQTRPHASSQWKVPVEVPGASNQDAPCLPPFRYFRYIQRGGDPRADPEPAGGIIYHIWSLNTSECPWRRKISLGYSA